MATYTLARDGKRPMRFEGEILATSSGRTWAGTQPNRFYELEIYTTLRGSYMVAWHFVTQWQGETSHDEAIECASLETAIAELEDFDPIEWLQGYRALIARGEGKNRTQTAMFERRQQALEQEIRERYHAQVAQLAQALDVAEEV